MPIGVPGYSDNEPENRGRVEGKLSDSPITASDLETTLRQPVPEVWLNFDCRTNDAGCVNGSITSKIPPEAQPLIEKQWRGTLEFIYRDRMKKFADAQDMYDETQAHFGKSLQFVKKLENYTIQTPGGSRKISNGEAGDIGGFLVKSADEIIEKAKQN